MLLSSTSSGSSTAGRWMVVPLPDRHAAQFHTWTVEVWSLPSMRHATILVLVLLAGSLSSLAQDRALITGDAEDKQDTPVPDVRIVLRNDSLRIERSTTT